jgi:uncharacterized protein (DUF983 family)
MAETARRGGFLAAAFGRCPVCGQGKLFKSYLKVADTCTACGTNFKAAETGDGPVVFVLLIAGFVACTGLLVSVVAWNWTVEQMLIVWPTVALVLSLILMPVLKGLMVASQLKNKIKD